MHVQGDVIEDQDNSSNTDESVCVMDAVCVTVCDCVCDCVCVVCGVVCGVRVRDGWVCRVCRVVVCVCRGD